MYIAYYIDPYIHEASHEPTFNTCMHEDGNECQLWLSSTLQIYLF